MYIVMHCMGMPFDGDTIKEKSLGGSETAAYYMAREFARAGHRVTLFTTSKKEGKYDGVKYIYCGEFTQKYPLGELFHYYAQCTPHDVLIIQRHPEAFRFLWAAKIKLWWVHDLALIRDRGEATTHMWNIDGVLTVSEYHKKQICEIYGINEKIVFPITNGVDLSLFEKREELYRSDTSFNQKDRFNLLYSSRPERGLENLLMPGGIMERLAKDDLKYHLYVCSYDYVVAEMKDYHAYLNDLIEKAPNVTNLDALTKQELADVMRQCDLLVYPTPGPSGGTFNEVSCITAMECMAAGLPFLSSKRGALPETCKDSGSVLLKPKKDGLVNIEHFTQKIKQLACSDQLEELKKKQLLAAPRYAWSIPANDVLNVIVPKVTFRNRSHGAVARHLMRMSDIYALRYFFESHDSEIIENDPILKKTLQEMNSHYAFAFENKWKEHYEAYYEYEKKRGVVYGPESLEHNLRYDHVSSYIRRLPDASVVLDYGCAHGHYTINLAKRFPKLTFVGIDIAKSNIETAKKWAEDEGIKNVAFYLGCIGQDAELHLSVEGVAETLGPFAAILAAEIIEHVEGPAFLCDALTAYLKDKGMMIITTPYGPWEAQGYHEHDPWRAHVHHFDRQDLSEMFGHHKDFGISVVPTGPSKEGLVMGSYVTVYTKPLESSRRVNYERKIAQLVPCMQTVSLCMIVKDGENTLRRSLEALQDVVDEVIIGIDETTTDRTQQIIDDFRHDRKDLWPIVRAFSIKSPIETGFDFARNITIEKASCDWILWTDVDEVTVNAKNFYKYLRNSQYGGYAISQHHFTIEPLGVLKTDFPCRLFRNHQGVKFYGVVHEHPERKINEGVDYVTIIPDVHLPHDGYTTEQIRRERFNRNIELLVRDREKYPDRKLGKFLWMRDLAQMCKYELELNGSRKTPEMIAHAKEGIKLWEELLAANELRMLIDGMEFYSLLANIIGGGFEFGFKIDSSKLNGGINLDTAHPIQAYFLNEAHAQQLMKAVTTERVKDYGSKYF